MRVFSLADTGEMVQSLHELRGGDRNLFGVLTFWNREQVSPKVGRRRQPYIMRPDRITTFAKVTPER